MFVRYWAISSNDFGRGQFSVNRETDNLDMGGTVVAEQRWISTASAHVSGCGTNDLFHGLKLK